MGFSRNQSCQMASTEWQCAVADFSLFGSNGSLRLRWQLPRSDLAWSSFCWEGSGGCCSWCSPRSASQSVPWGLSPHRWLPSSVGQPAALFPSCRTSFFAWLVFSAVFSAFCNFSRHKISEHLLACLELWKQWHGCVLSQKSTPPEIYFYFYQFKSLN